ncbi:MAG: transporter ATP-binding protein/permease [Cyanobacteria bacterium RYN_339]|nr:transporter ATP-binding protein/permease [Cyanobacteria bacterium RYN_339]
MTAVLTVDHVHKVFPSRFGQPPVEAVRDVGFQVASGEILGLLGPNGAGKTTTIKMIAGLLRPTSGTIVCAGYDVARHRSRAVRNLGAVLEGNRNLHWKLTVRENLQYFGALKGVPDVNARIDDLVARLDLGEQGLKRVGELSRGLQQRVAIAVALLGRPRVLLLDEPTLGLDVIASTAFKEIVRQIARDGCGIVLTTHQMEVAQELSDRVAVIARGRMAVIDSLDQLMAHHRTPGFEVVVQGAVGEALRNVLAALGAHGFAVEGARTRFGVPEGDPDLLYQVLDAVRGAGLGLVSTQQQEINLEAVYRRIVGEAAP